MSKIIEFTPNVKDISKFSVSIGNVDEVNPLFSKCFIKILYSGLNGNNVYIDKNVAEQMAKSLHNIPIVGEYVEKIEDFKDHGGKIEITNDSIEFIHTTKPYGVIPNNTDVQWTSITEADGQTREYLTCWGYLWTGRYPEAIRVIEEGNPQSMELDEETLEGQWVKEGPDIYFKISKAFFSALAILGSEVPPAFESASISAYCASNPTAFKKQFNKMLRELKENSLLSEKHVVNFNKQTDDDKTKGGRDMSDAEKVLISLGFKLSPEEIRAQLYNKIQPKDDEGNMSWKYSIHDIHDDRAIVFDHEENKHYRQYFTKEDNDIALGEKEEVIVKDLTEDESNALDQKVSSFEEVQTNYSQLKEETDQLKELKATFESTKEELERLRNFKQDVEKKEKQSIITKFASILAQEDLKDCQEKIDEMTKDEIESQLSVIAVRKNVSFVKNDDKKDNDDGLVPDGDVTDSTPGWLKIVEEHKRS